MIIQCCTCVNIDVHNSMKFFFISNFVQDGWTALIYACLNGHTDTGKMLLDHGAVIDHCDHEKVNDLQHVSTQY